MVLYGLSSVVCPMHKSLCGNSTAETNLDTHFWKNNFKRSSNGNSSYCDLGRRHVGVVEFVDRLVPIIWVHVGCPTRVLLFLNCKDQSNTFNIMKAPCCVTHARFHCTGKPYSNVLSPYGRGVQTLLGCLPLLRKGIQGLANLYSRLFGIALKCRHEWREGWWVFRRQKRVFRNVKVALRVLTWTWVCETCKTVSLRCGFHYNVQSAVSVGDVFSWLFGSLFLCYGVPKSDHHFCV